MPRFREHPYRYQLWLIIGGFAALTACNLRAVGSPTASSTPEPATPTSSTTPTDTPTATATPTSTPTPTVTYTPTITLTPSITPTPTVTPTPTFDFPDVNVNVGSAHCRYGPDVAYLHAADLYRDDHGMVWNRNYNASWLWVRFDKLNYACWVSATVVDLDDDPYKVVTYISPLPKSVLYGPVKKVSAVRNGNQVVVTWDAVWMTVDDDRGYFLRARVCVKAGLIDVYGQTNGTSYTFNDLTSCAGASSGKLYVVEKHGYTDPVAIPWP